MTPPAAIEFHYATRPFSFRNRNRLKKFLVSLAKREGQKVGQVSYIFCSDDFLLNINQEFLGHDDYTDIITFPLSAPNQPLVSEIYISIDRVRHNARQFKSGLEQELHRVIFHGALHLCGFRDKSQKEIDLMRRKEEEYLNRYFKRVRD
jgi:probable rRNA maturation factor